MDYHQSVLLKESVDGLNINPDGVYVDVTFGGGGHSREILSRLSDKGKLYAFDQDEDALLNTIDDARFTLIHENFKKVSGILADLGVSSHQFDVAERGFSTRFESDLDMRMSQRNELNAFKVVNEYSESALKDVFRLYGELTNAAAIANAICVARDTEAIETSEQLKKVLAKFLPAHKSHKILAQIYQAIRIEVNQEIEVLKEFLEQSKELLEVGGRLSVMSYHSLEDRLVKRYMRDGLFEGEPEKDFFGHIISMPFKKVGGLIVPNAAEIGQNNRARSAKLRIAEKL